MLKRIWRTTKGWLSKTTESALEEAYDAALNIKKIEDEHFQSKKISPDIGDYGSSVFAYFETELNSNLQIINLKMAQFKTSRLFTNLLDNNSRNNQNDFSEQPFSKTSIFLEKLKFIDKIREKYQFTGSNSSQDKSPKNNLTLETKNGNLSSKKSQLNYRIPKKYRENSAPINFDKENELETVSDKTSVLPRSFIRTLNKIRQEIDPKSAETEDQVIDKYRKSRYKTAISIKFLLLLIIVPLLVHNVSKIAIGQFFIDPYFHSHEEIVFLNQDLEEEAFIELKHFEEKLSFQSLIGLTPPLSKEELEEKIKNKADELSQEYKERSANGVKNVFADLISVGAFGLVIFYSKKEVIILKSFLDEMIYGLSDSAKAFLIILFTDMFVGFHSPHGWEIILEGVGRHFGLPENRDFNFLFIATFPVILDTVLKYWIFRYLNRISPSAVATYKNMNES
jgi:hypothetical protein